MFSKNCRTDQEVVARTGFPKFIKVPKLLRNFIDTTLCNFTAYLQIND